MRLLRVTVGENRRVLRASQDLGPYREQDGLAILPVVFHRHSFQGRRCQLHALGDTP